MTESKATDKEREALPCPFCGHTGVTVGETSTFRWRAAVCKNCGAECGEVRVQTTGEGTHEQWEEKAREDAIAEWNTRVAHIRSEPVSVDLSAEIRPTLYVLHPDGSVSPAALSSRDEATADAAWQPIETAPKDGTLILLWSRTAEEPATGLWQDVGLPQFFQPVPGMWVRDLYMALDPISNPYLPIHNVTHWMPLLAAPVESTDAAIASQRTSTEGKV